MSMSMPTGDNDIDNNVKSSISPSKCVGASHTGSDNSRNSSSSDSSRIASRKAHASRSPHKPTSSGACQTTPTIASTPSAHPLAQPPMTVSSSSSPAAQISYIPTPPPQVNTLRSALTRRRSSFPPSGCGVPIADTSFGTMPPTPNFDSFDFTAAFDGYSTLGESSGTGWTPGTGAWDALLNFDNVFKASSNKLGFSNLATADPLVAPSVTASNIYSRAQSDPLADHPAAASSSTAMCSTAQVAQQQPAQTVQPPANWPTRMAQMTSDLAWKTALASVVEVDGVGAVTLARILQEVWRRGGGDTVTTQCLWPSVIIALSMPTNPVHGVRIPVPSAQSAMSLQQMYNLSIRHWEPIVFTGLLGAYTASAGPTTASAPVPADSVDAFASQHFGASTPLRETDPSQWINLTPSGWSNLLPSSTGKGVTGSFEGSSLDLRRMSLVKTEPGEEQQIRGIDEILARMEESKEELERAQIAANLADQARDLKQETSTQTSSRSNSTYQLPTPETDSIDSPPNRSGGKPIASGFSPVSMASPFVSAGSTIVVQPTLPAVPIRPTNPQAPAPQLKSRPTQLSMPDNAFIPPPPMCMFFSPAFQDLQKGKMGVWQGDLEVRGRGGGKFPIMIVGEEGTGHLWQSNLWPETLTYPLTPTSVESCTSSMIPVSHLAREGLVPITMGMVLCKHTGPEIAEYVNMVQGLHAEGVGFHLPSQTRLPVVFLPAKFNSEDPLQRLGIAFMGKATSIPALMPSAGRGRPVTAGRSGSNGEKGEPKKKRRRQSAPASSALPMSGSSNGKAHKRKESVIAVSRIEEEVEGRT